MSKSAGFQFKRFYVRHDRCAMKVGTDGVLLGAWCPIPNDKRQTTNYRLQTLRILDIGTGSGLVALMLAQRFPAAQVDAIDINEAAVAQAAENFEQSPFATRLSAYHSSLQDWPNDKSQITNHKCYDLVVANPPYFQDSLKNLDKGREQARHTDTLSYNDLITHSARLLREDGRLALILPAEAEEQIRSIASAHSLQLTHVTHVYSKASKPARRVLLAFRRNTDIPKYRNPGLPDSPTLNISTLILENEAGGRSAAYSELCKEFYL